VKKEAMEFVSVTRNQQEPKRKFKPMMMLELAQQKLKKLVTYQIVKMVVTTFTAEWSMEISFATSSNSELEKRASPKLRELLLDNLILSRT
jgi:hypothetical protein